MKMFGYLIKPSIMNLKEFTVDSINYFGCELNFFNLRIEVVNWNTVYTFSKWTQSSETDLVERQY